MSITKIKTMVRWAKENRMTVQRGKEAGWEWWEIKDPRDPRRAVIVVREADGEIYAQGPLSFDQAEGAIYGWKEPPMPPGVS